MNLIQSALFFVLGAAGACLFMLLLVPMIWRRALTLATKAVRMEIPLSLNEVEAEHDVARALHAVEICRMEAQVATAKRHAMQARQALDSATAQICYLAPFAEESEQLQQKIIQMREFEKTLQEENSAQKLKLEKLLTKHQKTTSLYAKFKTQKSANKSLKRHISSLKRHINRLEKQIEAREKAEQIRRQSQTIPSEDLDALRQEMKHVAAKIVVELAQTQDSPFPPLEEDERGDDLAAAIHQAGKAKHAPPSLTAAREEETL